MKEYLQFWDMCKVNQDGYFSYMEYNSLFKVDLSSYKVEHVDVFPDENGDQVNLHRKVLKFENSLFFIPFRGSKISEYKIDNKEFVSYDVESKDGFASYSNAYMERGKIYLVPAYDGVDFAIFDCAKRKIKYLPNIWERIKKNISGDISFDIRSSLMRENKIIATVWGSNKILEINLEDERVRCISLEGNYKLRNVNCFDDLYWFSLTEGDQIISCDYSYDNVVEYTCAHIDTKEAPIFTVVKVGEEIVAIPAESSFFWHLDKECKNFEKMDISIPEDFYDKNGQGIKFVGYEVNLENELVLFPKRGKYMLTISSNLKNIELHMFKLENLEYVWSKVLDREFEKHFEHNQVIHEGASNMVSLANYLTYVQNSNLSENTKRT